MSDTKHSSPNEEDEPSGERPGPDFLERSETRPEPAPSRLQRGLAAINAAGQAAASVAPPTDAAGAEMRADTEMFPVSPPLRPHTREQSPTGKRLALLTLTAIGVVYGDIGTSPLYAIKECFGPRYGIVPTRDNIFGILSLVVWSLILVISFKYISFILRANNRGEGGTLALLALIFPRGTPLTFANGALLVAIALFGAALLYGDGIITPAMSVLGAMEGLPVAFPAFSAAVVPATLLILVLFFSLQRFGTDRVGRAFGPIMLVYFATIFVLGGREILRTPAILMAVNPWFAIKFALEHQMTAYFVLGSVVLVITGGEALYADMGHFGKKPIRLAWLGLVFPALLVNYFGQGALLIRDATAVRNPFYLLAPNYFQVPLLVIATLAAIVASQAMISGAYSLTRQGIQLGYIPRLEVRHTSGSEQGQIYIPEVNYFVAVGCLLIVLIFQSTSALGAMYGIAVTGTMTITTLLFYVVARMRFRWPVWKAALLASAFLVIDLLFFTANLLKFSHGGWVPLVLAAALFLLMFTWKRGRAMLNLKISEGALPLPLFLENVERSNVHRVAGTAVFMTGNDDGVPPVLLHHLKHNKVLHERVILLSVKTSDAPEVHGSERIIVSPLGQGFWRVLANYGFMQSPNVPQVLEVVDRMGIRCKPMETTYYLGRERLIPTPYRKGDKFSMARWRKVIFGIMARNARSATDFFGIPPNRVVELGTQIEI